MKHLFLFLALMGWVGCANETTSVTLTLASQSDEVENLIQQTDISTRLLYTNKALNGRIRVLPTEAGPPCGPCPPHLAPVIAWEKAFATGFSNTGTVEIPDLPLNVTGTKIAIEFLQTIDGVPYVVANTCWEDIGGSTKLTAEQLQADLGPGGNVLTIVRGRTCGNICGDLEVPADDTSPCQPTQVDE